MSIHGLGGGDVGGKLALQWEQLDSDTKRISIQIATNGVFTENYNHFILPNFLGMKGASLAVSRGPWYFRVGAWKISTSDVEWSGVLGPLSITTERSMKPAEKTDIKFIHFQKISQGIRIHTGLTRKYSVLVEVSTDPSFTLSKTKYQWVSDNNINGYFDVLGLDQYNKYNIRYGEVKEPDNCVIEVGEWIITKNHKPLPQQRHFTPADKTLHQAEKVLLEEARQRPMRFSSGADYANYLAAQEKAKGALSRVQ